MVVFHASQRTETEGQPSDTRQGTSAWADERSSGTGGWLGVHAEMATSCELARVRSSGAATGWEWPEAWAWGSRHDDRAVRHSACGANAGATNWHVKA
jgi:hypothetical protein